MNHASAVKELIASLNDRWLQQNVRVRPGAASLQLEAFESKNQVRLPADLREYFLTIDGMEEWEVDEDMFSFLSLQSVKSIPEELAHCGGIPDYREIMQTLADPERWFVIVDYSITSAVFAIRLSADVESSPVISIGSGTRHRIVAPTFRGFLEAYLANPFELL